MLIPYLPRQQLLGQHRECCALRGKGWGRKHSTVDYVFKYSRLELTMYHFQIMMEMEDRGYKVDNAWYYVGYLGKRLGCEAIKYDSKQNTIMFNYKKFRYPEHDDDYLKECLDNLEAKGVSLDKYIYDHMEEPTPDELRADFQQQHETWRDEP